jgi:hypothetical protein
MTPRREKITLDRAKTAERALVHAGYLHGPIETGAKDSGPEKFNEVMAHFLADLLHLASARKEPIASEEALFKTVVMEAMRYYKSDGATFASRTLDLEAGQ